MEQATRREPSGTADDGGAALAAARAAERRGAFSDGLDRAPIGVGIPEAKVQANRAPIEVEHRAGLDAVLEVRGARLTDESAEPRARVDGRAVERGGAR